MPRIFPDGKEHIMHDVLGLSRVAKDAQCGGIEGPAEAIVKFGEGRAVATRHALQQAGIGIAPILGGFAHAGRYIGAGKAGKGRQAGMGGKHLMDVYESRKPRDAQIASVNCRSFAGRKRLAASQKTTSSWW
jgi:hypothetical protein